jgi:Flp pilus assembly protein TadG
MQTSTCSLGQHRDRRGTSALEVLVAFTLLSSVLALSTPLVVAHGRLLKAQRNYRLALDELSNQLDRLTTLPEPDLPKALDELVPSPLTASRLPGATLRGQLAETELGKRVTVEIWWDEPNHQAAPLRLAAWVLPRAGHSSSNEE